MPFQTPSQALQHGRSLIRELAARHHTANPRVFGSVLTGQDREGSDLDVSLAKSKLSCVNSVNRPNLNLNDFPSDWKPMVVKLWFR